MSREMALKNFYMVKEAVTINPVILGGVTSLSGASTLAGGRVGRSIAMRGLDDREKKRFKAKYKQRLALRDSSNFLLGSVPQPVGLAVGIGQHRSSWRTANKLMLGAGAVTPLIAGARDYRLTKKYLKEPRG